MVLNLYAENFQVKVLNTHHRFRWKRP